MAYPCPQPRARRSTEGNCPCRSRFSVPTTRTGEGIADDSDSHDLDDASSKRRRELRVTGQVLDHRNSSQSIGGYRAGAALLHFLIVVEHVNVRAEVAARINLIVANIYDAQHSVTVATRVAGTSISLLRLGEAGRHIKVADLVDSRDTNYWRLRRRCRYLLQRRTTAPYC